ncbi:MAG TPA: TIGR03435 family protein, partial [Bryobacteraceae bacterium]|nr:TIGR03435 family protein [Bryobacteraceae bacterium]
MGIPIRQAKIIAGLLFPLAVASPAGPAFEVAIVKPSAPPSGDLININIGTFRNGKLTFSNASLSDCLKFAYGIVSDSQLAGPDWIKSMAVR